MKAAAPIIHNNKGKWIERVPRAAILLCVCGNKYIKTRTAQTVCLICISKTPHKN